MSGGKEEGVDSYTTSVSRELQEVRAGLGFIWDFFFCMGVNLDDVLIV